jgi:hypothetical protein
MDTLEILECVKSINGKVFAYDEIPLDNKIKEETFFAIINNAPIAKNGHWILICIFNNKPRGKNIVYYMDSLGIYPTLKNVIKFINLNTTGKLVCNKLQMQSETSQNCGKFCILCMHHLYEGKSFESFIEIFSSPDPKENDKKVVGLFDKFSATIKTHE